MRAELATEIIGKAVHMDEPESEYLLQVPACFFRWEESGDMGLTAIGLISLAAFRSRFFYGKKCRQLHTEEE